MADFLSVSGKDLMYRGVPVKLRGVNHNNQLALCARVGTQIFGSCSIADVDIVEADYVLMSSYGINHVRWGMSYRWYADDRAGFFAKLDENVKWAKANKIWIIWNLFTTPNDCYEGYSQSCPIWSDAAEQQALIDFWVDMATYYLDEPVIAAFGLLNEPEPPAPGFSTTWDTFAQRIITAVRAVNSHIILAVNATSAMVFNQTFSGGNILYEVHDYLPGAITHNATSPWPGFVVDYDSNTYYWDKNAIHGIPDSPFTNIGTRLSLNWCTANNVPSYMGEWGCRLTATGHVQYVLDHADTYLNFYDISHAYFIWRGGPNSFALFPINENPPTPFEPAMLAAAATSWNGARPTFPFRLTGTVTKTTPSASRHPEVVEAADLVGRILDALSEFTTVTTGREGADLRRLVGDLRAHARGAISDGTIGTGLQSCFDAALPAGASVISLDLTLARILEESPVYVLGKAIQATAVVLATVEQSRLVADMEFASRGDVQKVLTQMVGTFETVKLDLAEAMDSACYAAETALAASLISHLAAAQLRLPEVVIYQLMPGQPALLLAQQIYGDGGRAEELIIENHVPHPAFFPGTVRALSE